MYREGLNPLVIAILKRPPFGIKEGKSEEVLCKCVRNESHRLHIYSVKKLEERKNLVFSRRKRGSDRKDAPIERGSATIIL